MNSKEIESHPPEPQRMSAGRYAEQIWEYKDEILPFSEAALRYERDRADYYLQELRRIEGAYSRAPNEVAFKVAHAVTQQVPKCRHRR